MSPNRPLAALVVLAVIVAACGASAATTTSSSGPVDVDWEAVVDQTRRVDTVTVRVEVGTRGGPTSGFLAVTTGIDFDAVLVTTKVASQGVAVAEVLVVGDRSWLRLEDDTFRAALPPGVEYVEAAAADLVAAGIVSTTREATWFPLDFLGGVAESVLVEGDAAGPAYELVFDAEAVTAGLTPESRTAFLELFAGMFDADFISGLNGRAVLDEDNRVVDLTVVATPNPNAVAGRPVDLFFRQVLDDIDEPVEVSPPDPATVVDIDAIPGLREGLTQAVPTS